MANIKIAKVGACNNDAVLYNGNCYKFLQESPDPPDTTPASIHDDCEDCKCDNAVSVEYSSCECGDSIFVDPAVLSGLTPPPPVIEISTVCYQYVECSQTAIDTFSIDSEPATCDDSVCADVFTCPVDCSSCSWPLSIFISGITGSASCTSHNTFFNFSSQPSSCVRRYQNFLGTVFVDVQCVGTKWQVVDILGLGLIWEADNVCGCPPTGIFYNLVSTGSCGGTPTCQVF